MDRKQAFTILGISGNTDKTELKKQLHFRRGIPTVYKEHIQSEQIFYVPAMIEGVSTKAVKNTSLYPESLRNHKLYVCDKDKKSYGYISFADDILSFAEQISK